MTIPFNRLVAFAGPYISLLAASLATWLVARLNVLGIPGLDHANLATHIAAGLTWVVTAGVTWAGQSKWLKGHHILMQAQVMQATAVLRAKNAPDELVNVKRAAAGLIPVAPVAALEPFPPADPLSANTERVLPSDVEEFAFPPPEGERVRVSPVHDPTSTVELDEPLKEEEL